MHPPLNIGFLSSFSPEDKKVSSGTNYYIARSISEFGKINWLPIYKSKKGKLINYLERINNKISTKKLHTNGIFALSKLMFKQISKEDLNNYDILIAFFCSSFLANIKIDKPIIYFTDATFPAMIDYYPSWKNLYNFNKSQGIEIEKKAMDNSKLVIVSSEWTRQSAINDLHQNPDKVKVIEFGANIDEKDIFKEKRIIGDVLEILFLGVDWKRKGGDIAVDAVKWLYDNGIQSRLHIIGIKQLPKKYKNYQFIVNYGFLNKNNPEEYKKLTEILNKSNILLLPTLAECAGIAFAEASANGLPIFTHETGGISNYVYSGKNGYLLPIGSSGEDFGKKIKDVLDNGELESLSSNAKKIYQDKLNWNVWRYKVEEEIVKLIRK